jgi:hypothetical protein
VEHVEERACDRGAEALPQPLQGSAGTFALCLWGVPQFCVAETAAIQFYSLLKKLKIKTIKYFIIFYNVL